MNQLTQTLCAFIIVSLIAVGLRYISQPPAPREDTRKRFDSGATVAQVKAIGKVIVDRGSYIAVEFTDGRKTNVLPEQVAPITIK